MINKKQPVKVAVLDLYNGIANTAISAFEKLLTDCKSLHGADMDWQIFDVRKNTALPGDEFDIYICSGGPGNPFTAHEEWDKRYFELIESLDRHNRSSATHKKYVLFICHSFQLMCRQYNLGTVCLRKKSVYGIVPATFVNNGNADTVFNGLNDPFYVLDSRSWQVINPDERAFEKMGAQLLAIEQDTAISEAEPAMMAIRFSPYFIGTQFHPEAEPAALKNNLLTATRKNEVITAHGEAHYHELLRLLNKRSILGATYDTIIPGFLKQAINGLKAID